ncbi:MAG: outer membrane lipoprotein carrier protein LolA [Deltaproteobacteria bacterium]|nr:outer membrane lipoprotein carrier protein LolA [Deltaproteobacteria bacterium]
MKRKQSSIIDRLRPWMTMGMGILFILCLPHPGWTSTLAEFKAAAQKIHTLSADFIQEKHLKILSTPLLSHGVFYYEAPDHLRWEYLKPVKSLLLMNGSRVSRYIWTEDGFVENSGLGVSGMQGVFGEIHSWMKGDFGHDPAFQVVFEEPGRILLVPREKALHRLISKIVLLLSDQPGVIQSVTVYEGEDAFTRIVFKHIKVNAPLAASAFDVPNGKPAATDNANPHMNTP